MHDRVEWLGNQEGYSFDTMRESKETSIARNWLFKVARASESLERLAPSNRTARYNAIFSW